jgi:hypothetical protein
MPTTSNLNERIASLETKVELHKKSIDEDYHNLKRSIEEANVKLDSLLELKHKGAGAFWLASAIFGTGIVSLFYTLLSWVKG